MRAMRIASIGECTIDHYMDLKKEYVGGISLNLAVHCKRSGAEHVSFISRIGKDDGDKILKALEYNNVDTSQIKRVEGPAARQKINLTSSGERIFPPGGYDPGVLENFQLDEAEIRFVQSHNILASAMFEQ